MQDAAIANECVKSEDYLAGAEDTIGPKPYIAKPIHDLYKYWVPKARSNKCLIVGVSLLLL
jgi:hypothetical protein